LSARALAGLAGFSAVPDRSCHQVGGNVRRALICTAPQKLLKSFDLKVEYFETLVSTGVVGRHDIAAGSADKT